MEGDNEETVDTAFSHAERRKKLNTIVVKTSKKISKKRNEKPKRGQHARPSEVTIPLEKVLAALVDTSYRDIPMFVFSGNSPTGF